MVVFIRLFLKKWSKHNNPVDRDQRVRWSNIGGDVVVQIVSNLFFHTLSTMEWKRILFEDVRSTNTLK